MSHVKRLVLDVLKPHEPNALEFCKALAEGGHGYKVKLRVVEIDEKTDTLQLIIEADDIDFERLQQIIRGMGASVHSIDEVEVWGAVSATP